MPERSRPPPTHRLRFGRPVPGGRPDGENGFLLAWRGPALMGIVNVTPDSFSDGGRHADGDAAVEHGRRLVADGARWLDIGGESTRPGAEPVAAAEEWRRVGPVVTALAADATALISIDTAKPDVAEAALAAGAHAVNDVTGLRDPAMAAVCARHGAAAIVMHMQGEPRTMQREPRYHDVVAEVERFLLERAEAAQAAGVPGVVIDPGIGFGKTVEHNLALLRASGRLADHGYPLLVGASRKGFLGRLSGVSAAAERDPGSVAVGLTVARLGVALLRVHDVAAHRQALAVQAAFHGEPTAERLRSDGGVGTPGGDPA